jgi:hypothetical protein
MRIIELIQKNRHIKLAGNEKLRIERELPDPKDRAQMVRDVETAAEEKRLSRRVTTSAPGGSFCPEGPMPAGPDVPDSGPAGAWGRLKEPLRAIFSIRIAASRRGMAMSRY